MPEKELPLGKGRRPELAADSESNGHRSTLIRGAYRQEFDRHLIVPERNMNISQNSCLFVGNRSQGSNSPQGTQGTQRAITLILVLCE